ncbi:MAG: hypothetical protein N2594_06045 [Clostridiales bacterium]|nr:hypothetical protein [Clostridiales bacterium]
MKKITLIIAIILISIFGFYIYDADIEIDKNDRRENIIWCPDNTKVAFKYFNNYKIFDRDGNLLLQVNDNKLRYKTYKWILNDGKWNFIETYKEEKPINITNSKELITGELYSQQYNPEGTIIIDKLILNFKDYLVAIDRKSGEYYIIKKLDTINSLDIKYIDKNYALIKIEGDRKDKIYLLNVKNSFKLEEIQLSKLNNINLTENSIRTITNYKIDNYYIIYCNLKNKELIYNNLNNGDYYYLSLNKHYQINLPNIFLADVYKDNLFLVSKSGDVYKIYSVDVNKNTYTLIYKSNNLIDDIRVIDGKLYFTELNILNDISSYKLFKFDGEIKQIVLSD